MFTHTYYLLHIMYLPACLPPTYLPIYQAYTCYGVAFLLTPDVQGEAGIDTGHPFFCPSSVTVPLSLLSPPLQYSLAEVLHSPPLPPPAPFLTAKSVSTQSSHVSRSLALLHSFWSMCPAHFKKLLTRFLLKLFHISLLPQPPPSASSLSLLPQPPPSASSPSLLPQPPPSASSFSLLPQPSPSASSLSLLPQPSPSASSLSLLPQPRPSASSLSLLPQPPPPASSPSLLPQPPPPASSLSLLPQPPPPASSLSLLPQPPPSASSLSLLPQPPPQPPPSAPPSAPPFFTCLLFHSCNSSHPVNFTNFAFFLFSPSLPWSPGCIDRLGLHAT